MKPTALLALLLPLAACATPGAQQAVRIEHVVLCWLREPDNAEDRERVLEASEQLRTIPVVRTLHVGTPLPSDRDVADDSFDVGLVIGVDSEADLEAYLLHPEHVRRVDEVFGPLSARLVVYDIRR